MKPGGSVGLVDEKVHGVSSRSPSPSMLPSLAAPPPPSGMSWPSSLDVEESLPHPALSLSAPPLPANAPRRIPEVCRKALIEGRERHSVATAKSLATIALDRRSTSAPLLP
jgi:hypothetical protein